MAVADFDSITDALGFLYDSQVTAQMNRSIVLLQLLPCVPATSKVLAWSPEFGDDAPTTPTLPDGDAVTDFDDDDIEQAKLDFGTYSQAFGVTGKAAAAARASGNPDELADLFGEKIERAIRRQAKSLGVDIYTGTGGDALVGLVATNGGIKATGTYATIVRGSQAQWAGTEKLNGGNARDLSLLLMRETKRSIYEASGEYPDLIVCDAFQHDAYGELLGDSRRYNQDVTMRGQKITLDGGYQALTFDGIPVVADVNCPAGKMLFLNTNHVKMRQIADGGSPWQGGMGTLGVHGTAEAQFGGGNTGLRTRINPLSRAGDAYKFQLVCYPQIQVKKPNANGILGDLSLT